MAGVAASKGSLRFGAFEVDLCSGELRSHGSKVHLQPQPFQILCILLEHPGELVTREEIRQRLWSSDTFVDFEHSLNTSIKKPREALGEEAGVPRYIETLPRRGYRFIGHVEPVETSSPTPTTETSHGSTEVEVGAGLVPAQRNDVQGREADAHLEGERGRAEGRSAPATIAMEGHPQGEQRRTERRSVLDPATIATEGHPQEPALNAVKGVPLRRILTVVAGVAVVLLAAYLAHLFYSRGRPQTFPVAIRSLAVLPLENLSGDKEQEYFADGLTDALITDLGKVVTLRVISRTSVMRYKGAKKALPDIARELNVDAVVEGTVQRSGDRVRVTAQLLDARTATCGRKPMSATPKRSCGSRSRWPWRLPTKSAGG